MPKFRRGQRVRVVANSSGHGFPVGLVIEIDSFEGRSSTKDEELFFAKFSCIQKPSSWYVYESDVVEA